MGPQDSYKVQWTDGTNNWNKTINETAYTITNLASGVMYSVTVSAVGLPEGKGQTVSLYTSRFFRAFLQVIHSGFEGI